VVPTPAAPQVVKRVVAQKTTPKNQQPRQGSVYTETYPENGCYPLCWAGKKAGWGSSAHIARHGQQPDASIVLGQGSADITASFRGLNLRESTADDLG
jgi:hypothetical protein